ncbi:alcohol dehydrogenase catalytic domain-containing protein [Pseudomonas sp. H11T01]|uniref:alcohol dehydrogenase catalytic domain-containing protein n=1 Tax=Pseudomonas sp. H11T01 TaxID=3402749 RepID=UPI003ACBCB96
MHAIVHERLGLAGEVLELRVVPEPGLPGEGEVLVRVTFAPIHRGDLLAIEGSPAFGDLVSLSNGTRIPGFEGVGIVEALGSAVVTGSQVNVGDRVAFFPVSGAWCERVVAPMASLVRLPDEVTDEQAAHMLINTITARLVLSAGHNALPSERKTSVTVIQTGASSAVGQLLTALLIANGVDTIRLVRSEASASALAKRMPGPPIVSTENADWKDVLQREIDGRPIFTVFDGVGGVHLSEVASFLIEGGTIVNYGSLGGAGTDIRGIAPRSLVLRGVSIGEWKNDPPEQRRADMDTALGLVQNRPELFDEVARFEAADITAAIAKMSLAGKSGAVLLSF